MHVLDGGIVAWLSTGGAVNHGPARWDLERQVRLTAGSIVLASVLGSVVVPQLKWVAGAVGAGLTGAALTNSCLMGKVLSKLPYNRGASCDIDTVLGRLAG